MWGGSPTAPPTLRIRSVAAIAKTPSANVSSRATRYRGPAAIAWFAIRVSTAFSGARRSFACQLYR